MTQALEMRSLTVDLERFKWWCIVGVVEPLGGGASLVDVGHRRGTSGFVARLYLPAICFLVVGAVQATHPLFLPPCFPHHSELQPLRP